MNMAGKNPGVNMVDRGLLDKAVSVIVDGGVVIIATETYYCIAANPFNEESVKRIFMLKGRPFEKPLPLITWSVEMLSGMVSEDSADAFELGQKFWPGSLTVLLNVNAQFPAILRDANRRVGVRVAPDCPAVRLAVSAGGWITATSANLSGGPNASVISDVPESLLEQVDCVVDTGGTPGGSPSTVMALEGGRPVIYRPGAVSLESLTKRLLNQGDKCR